MKIYKIIIAALAVFAFSAMLSSTASAEATLLAEYLIKSLPVTGTVSLLTTTSKFKYFDPIFLGNVTCELKTEGTVGEDGAGSTTKILTITSEERSLASPFLEAECKVISGCEAGKGVEVSPEELPWTKLMYLDASGKFLDFILKMKITFTCTILFIKATDECTYTNASFELLTPAEGAEATGEITPLGTCSVGGANSATNEFVGPNHLQNLAKEAIIPSSGA